jgi:hypothetical protein
MPTVVGAEVIKSYMWGKILIGTRKGARVRYEI